MRITCLIGGLALLLAFQGPAATQSPPPAATPATDVRYISVPEAQARSGPSERFYPTNRLRQGEKVQVLHERGDWVAIRPPDGSFSWINTRYLQNVVARQPNYVVTPEGMAVPVMIGSTVIRERPTVEGAKLQRGAQVKSVGAPQAASDGTGTWMPIEPPAAEVRYVQASALSKTQPALVPAVTTAFGGAVAAGGPAPPPSPDALWQQAQQAERAGHMAEAIRLYEQAGYANLSVNPERAMEAYQRARSLQSPARQGVVPTSTYVQSGDLRIPSSTPEVRYATNTARPGYAPVAAVSLSPPAPAGQSASWGAPGAPGSDRSPASPQGYRGRLRRAGRTVEYQRTYVLMDNRGIPILYATGAPGVDLEPYINREVELCGSIVYRGEIRANYMTVGGVQLLQ